MSLKHGGITAGPFNHFPGGHRSRATPVPIPNTEVKPATADGTAEATLWESRSLPGIFFRPLVAFAIGGLFLCTAGACAQGRDMLCPTVVYDVDAFSAAAVAGSRAALLHRRDGRQGGRPAPIGRSQRALAPRRIRHHAGRRRAVAGLLVAAGARRHGAGGHTRHVRRREQADDGGERRVPAGHRSALHRAPRALPARRAHEAEGHPAAGPDLRRRAAAVRRFAGAAGHRAASGARHGRRCRQRFLLVAHRDGTALDRESRSRGRGQHRSRRRRRRQPAGVPGVRSGRASRAGTRRGRRRWASSTSASSRSGRRTCCCRAASATCRPPRHRCCCWPNRRSARSGPGWSTTKRPASGRWSAAP